jgi:hypothetical protein
MVGALHIRKCAMRDTHHMVAPWRRAHSCHCWTMTRFIPLQCYRMIILVHSLAFHASMSPLSALSRSTRADVVLSVHLTKHKVHGTDDRHSVGEEVVAHHEV